MFTLFVAAGGQLMDLHDGKVNHLDHGMYKPSFKPTPRNVTVGPGDRAVLRCKVENLGTKTVSLFWEFYRRFEKVCTLWRT